MKMNRKFKAFATGAAFGALGIAIVDLVMVGDAFAHLKVATNTSGPYRLTLLSFPGTAKTGQTSIAQAVLTQSGKPMANQTVSFTVNGVAKPAQTDITGTALMPLTYFQATTVTIQASWQCPCGKTITDSVTVRWRGKTVTAS